jgi:hypothetical protein
MLSGANTRLRPACSRDLSPEGSITGHLPPVSPFSGRVGPKSEKCTENLCQLAVQLTKTLARARAIGVPTPCLLGVWVVGGGGGTHPAVTVGGSPQLLPSGFGLLRRRRDTSAVTVGGHPPCCHCGGEPSCYRPRRPTPPPSCYRPRRPTPGGSIHGPRIWVSGVGGRIGGKVTRSQPPRGVSGVAQAGGVYRPPFRHALQRAGIGIAPSESVNPTPSCGFGHPNL